MCLAKMEDVWRRPRFAAAARLPDGFIGKSCLNCYTQGDCI